MLPGATINTESPVWAIDRLSILQLKIYHMREREAERAGISEESSVALSRLSSLCYCSRTKIDPSHRHATGKIWRRGRAYEGV